MHKEYREAIQLERLENSTRFENLWHKEGRKLQGADIDLNGPTHFQVPRLECW